MAQALVCSAFAASQHSNSVKFHANKQASATLCCTARRLSPRQCRTCGAYQQEVEETFRPKAPSTAPGPDTTRRPPPPPPPPPPASPSGQFSGQTRRTMLALVGICSVAYGYNITQRSDAPPAPATDSSPAMAATKSATAIEQSAPARSSPAGSRSETPAAKSADVYANSELRPTRVWPIGAPENPYTQVIMWRKAPYARLRNNGWMRVYGMQSGRTGKVELIMEARGGKQYTLEVPLKQVRPWDVQFMNALFNSLIDWDSHLKPFAGKIKNRDPTLQ